MDVINEAARRSRQTLEWVQVDDVEKSFDAGKIDVYPLLTVTPDRLSRFHFSEYWWQNSLQLVSPQQRYGLDRAADAAGKKIGLAMVGSGLDLAHTLFPAAKLIVKPNTNALVNSLCCRAKSMPYSRMYARSKAI